MQTDHTQVEAHFLHQIMRPGLSVLEAGCGVTTRLAAYRDQITRLVGVDADARAGAENRTIDEFVELDLCEPLPFADGTFDLVYSNFVLEHLQDPCETFTEWLRVLRPEGHLVVLTSNSANPLLALARALPHRARSRVKNVAAGVAEEDVYPAVYRANTPSRLRAALTGAGFEVHELALVATLHRYAANVAGGAPVLRGFERCLPPRMRSTMVAWCGRPSETPSSSSVPAVVADAAGADLGD